jgi:GH15 family glucan-1,4-alpha-glucosidase
VNEKIDAYGLIGDLGTAALVSARGNLRWLCWPDFDSQACFASLVGTNDNGYWSLAPKPHRSSKRRYIDGTLVLETTYTRSSGTVVTVIDFMPVRDGHSCVVRIVHGIKGTIRMTTCLAPRFDYGSAQPRIERQKDASWSTVTGPHRLVLRSNVELQRDKGDLTGEWLVKAGESYYFVLQHSISYGDPPPPVDARQALDATLSHWRNWTSRGTYHGKYEQEVQHSLLMLKALTYAETGAFVAAPTTSLPEKVGGVRNWDYRFCWLRDSTFSLLGLLHCGHGEEAAAWVQWLARSVQGDPAAVKILYGVTGKREHSEWEANWLPGYEASRPVHIGNKASEQLQLDTFGELLDTLYRARCAGIYPLEDESGQGLEVPLLEHLEKVWSDPDEGLWEFRSGPRQFTLSKVMAWVAFDRGIRMAEEFSMKGPVERWKKIKKRIHEQVCCRGFHRGMNSFTQSYGITNLDASLLLLPLVGFLPVQDSRITGTVEAIEDRLMHDGLLLRYDTKRVKDGLPAGEGAFLACSFWLVDVYVLQGRIDDARKHFENLLSLCNDLGLLSEECDSKHGLIGNFPQAISHIALINAALALELGTSVRLKSLS